MPSIRANFGTAITLSVFGMEQQVFPDKMPWLQTHLDKPRAAALMPDDIAPRGSLVHALDYVRFFRESLGDAVPVYVYDTQGPLAIVHGLIGDKLLYEMVDDPIALTGIEPGMLTRTEPSASCRAQQ